MKGYVYLDMAGNLEIKNATYIDEQDPGFFQKNSGLISLVWKFDTENEGMMYELMSSFKRRQLPKRIVQEFCNQAKFDLQAFLDKYKQAPLKFEQPPEK